MLSVTDAAVAQVLRKSTALEVSSDNTLVRRINPIPKPTPLAPAELSVYVKGFSKTFEPSIDDITAFFETNFGPVGAVRMRRFVDMVSHKRGFKVRVFFVISFKFMFFFRFFTELMCI